MAKASTWSEISMLLAIILAVFEKNLLRHSWRSLSPTAKHFLTRLEHGDTPSATLNRSSPQLTGEPGRVTSWSRPGHRFVAGTAPDFCWRFNQETGGRWAVGCLGRCRKLRQFLRSHTGSRPFPVLPILLLSCGFCAPAPQRQPAPPAAAPTILSGAPASLISSQDSWPLAPSALSTAPSGTSEQAGQQAKNNGGEANDPTSDPGLKLLL